MFEYRLFMASSRPVPSVPVDPDAYAQAVAQQIAGRVLKVPGRSRPFFFPKGAAAEPITKLMMDTLPCFGAHDSHVAAMRDLLFQPAIVVPLRAEGRRSFALVSAFSVQVADDIVAVRVDITETSPIGAESTFAVGDDVEEFLEFLYLDAEIAARIVAPGPKQAPKVAWVGGSRDEGYTPDDWIEQTEAAMAVRGLATTVYMRPYRNFKNVRTGVHDLKPRALVIWAAHAGDPSGWTDLVPESAIEIKTDEWSFPAALSDVKQQLDAALAMTYDAAEAEAEVVPEPGEIRVFKKTYSTPGFDKLVETDDCGHNNWTTAHKAPKAEKGIERLIAHSGIRSLEKCLSCTGGGRWRVTFD